VAILPALASWLSEAGVPTDDPYIAGPTIGKFFILRLHSEAGLAARRLKKAFGLLKDGAGNWRQFSMPVAQASGSAALPKQVQLYVAPDKSDKVRQTEMALKKLYRVLQNSYGDKTFSISRKTSTIQADFVPIVKVEAIAPRTPASLRWNADGIRTTGLSDIKDVVAEKFREFGDEEIGRITWSI